MFLKVDNLLMFLIVKLLFVKVVCEFRDVVMILIDVFDNVDVK